MADNKLYEILGVDKNATDSEIKKVNWVIIYQDFSSIYHRNWTAIICWNLRKLLCWNFDVIQANGLTKKQLFFLISMGLTSMRGLVYNFLQLIWMNCWMFSVIIFTSNVRQILIRLHSNGHSYWRLVSFIFNEFNEFDGCNNAWCTRKCPT